jgi:hypothetical protein
MKTLLMITALASLALPMAPGFADPPYGHDRGRHKGWDKPGKWDKESGDRWYPERHYRRGREWRLGRGDRIYRGYDGRYYCRRSNGTTGLVVGALAGGVLGNVLANGRSETLGTLLGAGGGALLGRAIDRDNVRCR